MPVSEDSIWLVTMSDSERRELSDVPRQSPLPTADLLVLGSGIIGLATAYYAAEQGLRVQVVTDAPRLGADAELSLGAIIPNVCRWQLSHTTQQLGQNSRDCWARLAVRPEFQIDWRVTGALMVDERRLTPEPRGHMLAALEEGYSVHAIDADQVRLLEPQLSPLPLGGLHYPSEAVLHPLKAVCGFIRGLRRRGGRITQVDAISNLQWNGGRCSSVETSAGLIQPRHVVVDDPRWLDERIGSASTFESTRHVFLATNPQPPLLKRPVLEAHWIVQLKTGEIVIEAPVVGDEAAAAVLAIERTRQLIPALGNVEFTRAWSGASQRAADRTPWVARPQGLENVWTCGGLDFNHVLFAPIVGKSLVDEMQP